MNILTIPAVILLGLGGVGALIHNAGTEQGVTGITKSDTQWVHDEAYAQLANDPEAQRVFCLSMDEPGFDEAAKSAVIDSTTGVDLTADQIGEAGLAGIKDYCLNDYK